MKKNHANSHHKHDDSHDHHDPHAHDDHHNHGHGHGHAHAPKDFGKAFLFGILLNTGFVAIEFIFGILSNSVALLADAGHNLSDVLGLLLAWGASVLVKRIPSERFTYGLRSTSILAALSNAMLLLVVTGGIAWEAIVRFWHPGEVDGMTVIIVAAIGVVINLGTALLFVSGSKDDLNIRAAFLHMAGDAAISLGVVIAGIIILNTGWQWLDPSVSLIISVLIVVGTWGVLRDSINLALHAVPDGINAKQVQQYLTTLPGVSEIHDLHIWGMSTTETALTVHLVMPDGYPGDVFRQGICDELHQKFKIAHATIQIEINNTEHPCRLAPADVV
ncbi:MAG: cation transporter [Cytophaga sp.]|nr:cation transporter [Undibacterium sp.]